jgi:hypothetical protein
LDTTCVNGADFISASDRLTLANINLEHLERNRLTITDRFGGKTLGEKIHQDSIYLKSARRNLDSLESVLYRVMKARQQPIRQPQQRIQVRR